MNKKNKNQADVTKNIDQDSAAHEYIKDKWVDKDPEVVPEQCRTGRCGHSEHTIKHETTD